MNKAIAAHLRLMEKMPRELIHTHKSEPDKKHEPFKERSKVRRRAEKIVTGRGRGGHNKMPVIYAGVQYASIKEMARILHFGHNKIYRWIDEGVVKRV